MFRLAHFAKDLVYGKGGEPGNQLILQANQLLTDLPPTTIIAAQYDPLRSEGEMLSDNLKKANVNATYKICNGTTHEFFGMAAVIPEAKDAQAMAAGELKSAFNK